VIYLEYVKGGESMKLKSILRLGIIGITNALTFAFIPPLFSLLSRLTYEATKKKGDNIIPSRFDMPLNASMISSSDIKNLLPLLIVCIVAYINYKLIEKVLTNMCQDLKFIYSFVPIGCWITTVLFLILTRIYGEYLSFAAGNPGWFIGGSFIIAVYFFLLLLNGISLIISSMVAFFVSKHRQREKCS
jgi:hypothetical protein